MSVKVNTKDILTFLKDNLDSINDKRVKKKQTKLTITSLRKKNRESLIQELSRQNKPLITKFYKFKNIKGKSKLKKQDLKNDLLSYITPAETKTTKKKKATLRENLLKLKNETIDALNINFNNTQTRAETLKNIMNILPDSKVVLNLGNNNFFTLNKNNMNSLYQRINNLEYSEYDMINFLIAASEF